MRGLTCTHISYLVACAVVGLVVNHGRPADAGCADIQRCCPGKSSAACKYTYPYSKGRYARVCYCDAFCTKSRDCCDDYNSYCLSKAQDCVMSSWGPWSRCSARCGRGQSERRRRIEIYASNGGAGCGERRQTRGCYHNDRRCRNYEIAQLLPAHFNRKRDEPDKYERESEADKVAARKTSYCIHYRITALAWYCRYASPYHVLSVGSKVCAKCHDTAMDRNGKCKGSYTGVTSRWKALMGRPCNGRWKSEGGVVDNCDCGEVQGRDFIFV